MSQSQAGNSSQKLPTISTDPLADMLSRIRNAVLVNKNEIIVPHSNLKKSVAQLFVDNNFIDSISETKYGVGKMLTITINQPAQNARITEITRMSKPGRRWYAKASDIPKIRHGRGMVIVSTSKGMMTDRQARSNNIGGELICKVY